MSPAPRRYSIMKVKAMSQNTDVGIGALVFDGFANSLKILIYWCHNCEVTRGLLYDIDLFPL